MLSGRVCGAFDGESGGRGGRSVGLCFVRF